MDNFKFIVKCNRIGRRNVYSLIFPYNTQLVDRIKNLSRDDRKWNAIDNAWELTTKALYELIKTYRNSTLIKFDFGDDLENFKSQIRKIEEENNKTKKQLEKLAKDKIRWLKLKKEVEDNYQKYEAKVHSYLKEGVKLFPHQISATMYLNEVRSALISHEMGLGKAQDLDSKILTPDGWVRMGDIKRGDFVIGSDGKPKEVLDVFPQGLKDIYNIKFNDGTNAKSCDEHLWNVNTATRNKRGNPFLTKPLREIIDSGLQYANGNNKWYIPIVNPIGFEKRDLKIDPYVLGCILGNNGVVSRNNLINQALKYYSLSSCGSKTKFIPDIYKFSSIEQRLELLQGLLDTDGYAQKDGIIEIMSASEQLIKDIQFIVQSLGGIGRLYDKWVEYKGENRLYYVLIVKLPPQFVPFRLERKLDNFIAPTKYKLKRAIVDVEYVGKKEAKCILIDSDDHLYVTDNCVLTHNTLVSITYSELNEFEKVFVITPNSLKFNFYNEVEKFTNSKAHIINWKNNKHTIEESKYIIVNYEYFNPRRTKSKQDDKFLKKWNELKIDKIDALICDESHRLKNINNTYKNFKRTFVDSIFRNGKVSKVFLTGTPAPNRAYELYTVLNQISEIDFPTKANFYEYYCGMTYDFMNGWGYVVDTEETKFEELYHKIAPYTHRKRKEDVLKDLPEKSYQRLTLEMNDKDMALYEEIESGIANEFVDKPSFNSLTIMLRLRQYTSYLKASLVTELIDNILNSNEKVVVVDVFKESLYELHNKYKNISVLHTGDEKDLEVRNKMVEQFQNPKSDIKIFLASTQTANYGLTLTAASKLIILTLPFSLGEYDQVSSRLHRISQKNAVNIYVPIFPNTIDDYVYSSIESKRKEVLQVIDNIKYQSETSDSIMSEVIEKIKKKHGI